MLYALFSSTMPVTSRAASTWLSAYECQSRERPPVQVEMEEKKRTVAKFVYRQDYNCSIIMVRRKKHTEFWQGNPKEKGHLENRQ
jgi:hypothetical protein